MVRCRYILYFLFTLLCTITFSALSFAGDLSGAVVSTSDGSPLENVLVTLRRENGAVAAFSQTDSQGRFSLTWNDTISNPLHIEIKSLGYETITLYPPFEKNITASLRETAYELPEVSVSAKKVEKDGDTITYYVQSLISQGDRVLGDVLKKLTGVHVNQGGYIKYLGKDISHFYIDSVDLLDSRYNIAVKNIDPQDISRIEIYENHQHIKALRGIIKPEEAAINIILKEDSRDTWITSLAAGAGVSPSKPWVPYSANVLVMNIGGGFMTMNTAAADATGNTTAADESIKYELALPSMSFKDRYNPGNFLSISHSIPPLDAPRARFNSTYSVTSHNKFNIKDALVGISGIFRYEGLDSRSISQTVYNDGNNTVSDFTEINSVSSNEYYGAVDLSAEINTRRSFINNKTRIEYTGDDAAESLTGTSLRNQNAGRQHIDIMNDLSLIRRSAKGRSLSFRMFSEYQEKTENLTVDNPSDNTLAQQGIHGRYFYNNVSFSSDITFRRHWTFSSDTYLRYLYRLFDHSLSGTEDPQDNSICVQYLLPEERLTLSFEYGRFNATLLGSLRYQYLHSTLEDRRHHFFSLSPKLYLSYRFGPRLKISASGEYRIKNPDECQIFSGFIMSNYKYLTSGRTELMQTPSWHLTASLDFSEPLSGWTAAVNASYSSEKNFQATRYFIEDYIVSVLSDNLTDYSSASAHASVSKTFLNSGSKITADFTFSDIGSTINQDGLEYRYTGQIYNTTLSCTGMLSTWMSVNYTGTYNFNRFATDGEWSGRGNHASIQNLSLSFFPTERIEISASLEYYLDKADGRKLKQTPFIDASAEYKITDRISLSLTAKNLLNSKTYAYSVLMPLQSLYYEFRLRPLNVLLGVNIRF